jgi:membrane protease YdiL (CAAX protease family)
MNKAVALSIQARSAARRDLVAFLVLVAVLSAPWQIRIGRTQALEDTNGILWVAGLMWMPALASVIVRLSTRQGFADVTFRRTLGPRWLLSVPLAVAAPAYVLALLLDLVQPEVQPVGKVVALITASAIANVVLAPGEEIGWRGFMVTRLVDAGVPAPLVTGGLIWGAWHVPLVIWGGLVPGDSPTWISVAQLMFLVTLIGFVLGQVRLTTGSVWPPILLHIIWNVVFQAVFAANVTGRHEGLWVGEFGVLTTVMVGIAFVLARGTHDSHAYVEAPRGASAREIV